MFEGEKKKRLYEKSVMALSGVCHGSEKCPSGSGWDIARSSRSKSLEEMDLSHSQIQNKVKLSTTKNVDQTIGPAFVYVNSIIFFNPFQLIMECIMVLMTVMFCQSFRLVA